MSKKELGQFYTKNKNRILKNMIRKMPFDVCSHIFVDPFAGELDLIKWINLACKRKGVGTEAYDIDTNLLNVEHRNSFLNPPVLKGKYVITNPPYLAKNKTKDKTVFNAYDTDDLYKASIKMVSGWDIEKKIYSRVNECEGGIFIVPLNFFCDRDYRLRSQFIQKYKIISFNVFEEQVFSDTTYTVCSFNFSKRKKCTHSLGKCECFRFKVRVYPDYDINEEDKKRGHSIRLTLSEHNNYTIGYEFDKLIKNKSVIKVGRLRKGQPLKEGWVVSKMFLRAVDTGSQEGRIKLSIKDEPFYGKISDRTSATIVLSKSLSEKEQELIIKYFNEILEGYREKYHSLFLTNFRNSTASYARKRINFTTAFNLVSHIIENYLHEPVEEGSCF